MGWNWYELFDRAEFEATGLVSRTLTVILSGLGEKEILITRGNLLGILIDDVFLAVSLDENNPFIRSGYGILEDEEGKIWLGVEQ